MYTHNSFSAIISPPPGRWFGIVIVGSKSPRNFGAIMRAAVNYRANVVFLVGCRYRKAPTDTATAIHHLPVVELDRMPSVPGAVQVWVDFAENAVPLPEFRHPKRALYIFGPEDGTLQPPDGGRIVYVPTAGSMNLAVSVGVILYDRMLQMSGHKNV